MNTNTNKVELSPEQEIGLQRLEQLADFDPVAAGHDRKFDFSEYHNVFDCGTSGCKIGECPLIWEEWRYWYTGDCLEPAINNLFLAESIEFWFLINSAESDYLFQPKKLGHHTPKIALPATATAEQVNERILNFVKNKREGKPCLV